MIFHRTNRVHGPVRIRTSIDVGENFLKPYVITVKRVAPGILVMSRLASII